MSRAEYMRKHRAERKEHYAEYAKTRREYQNTYRRAKKQLIRDTLRDELGNVCVSCGATEDLQFDHIDPTKKNHNISDIEGWDRAWAELPLVQLLCAPCHVAKTIANGDHRHRSVVS